MTSPIDHKDKSHKYRDTVFNEVRQRVGFEGKSPKDAAAFLGDWVYRLQSADAEPLAYQSFHADGRAPLKMVDGSSESPNDRWKLNDDGSFSDWYYVEAMPDYGIEEPGNAEERYHVLFRGADTFIQFNGDGSLIKYYERIKS